MKIYLAIPYFGNEKTSFIKANQKAAELMKSGHIVFSPISHSHPIAIQCGLPGDYEFWAEFDYSFLEWCDELWVYCLTGWKQSKGVAAEIKIAKKLNKPIQYIAIRESNQKQRK